MLAKTEDGVRRGRSAEAPSRRSHGLMSLFWRDQRGMLVQRILGWVAGRSLSLGITTSAGAAFAWTVLAICWAAAGCEFNNPPPAPAGVPSPTSVPPADPPQPSYWPSWIVSMPDPAATLIGAVVTMIAAYIAFKAVLRQISANNDAVRLQIANNEQSVRLQIAASEAAVGKQIAANEAATRRQIQANQEAVQQQIAASERLARVQISANQANVADQISVEKRSLRRSERAEVVMEAADIAETCVLRLLDEKFSKATPDWQREIVEIRVRSLVRKMSFLDMEEASAGLQRFWEIIDPHLRHQKMYIDPIRLQGRLPHVLSETLRIFKQSLGD